jgi:nucleotide-binding universal stress UspA family protein
VASVAPILICYDGSDGARAALETAALTFDRPMVVACYWQSFAETQKPMGIDLLEVVQDPASINDREQALAERYAHEGRDLVEAAGRTADGVAIKVTTPIDDAILSHADELDAHAIVLGSRSRSGLGSILLGDVAGDVVELSNRPVFVVPSITLAERRKAGRTRPSGAL